MKMLAISGIIFDVSYIFETRHFFWNIGLSVPKKLNIVTVSSGNLSYLKQPGLKHTLTKCFFFSCQLSSICWARLDSVFMINSFSVSCKNCTSSGSSSFSRVTDSWLHLSANSFKLQWNKYNSKYAIICF